MYDCNGDGCGEDVSNVINIEVFEDPEITIAADDVEVCLGETVDITASTSGGVGNCSHQWQRRPAGGTWANFGTGQTTSTAGTGFLSAPGTYQYRAIYNCDGSSCDEVTSNVVNIDVFADPEVTLIPDNSAVCLGETIDFTASVNGGVGSCSLQWQRRPQGGTWTDVHSGQSMVTAEASFLSAPGIYQYRAIYDCDGASCNSSTSPVIDVEVFSLPNVTVTHLDPTCCDDNGSITFSFPNDPIRTRIEFSNDGGVTYTDTRDNSGTFTFDNLTPGNYDLWVRWGDTDCPIDLSDVTLVNDTADPVIDVEASDEIVECDGAGNVAQLTAWLASNGGASVSDQCSDLVWTNDHTILSDGCGATGNTTVIFTVTDGCGNASTTEATFTIEDTTPPSVTTGPTDLLNLDCDAINQEAAIEAWLNNNGGGVAADVCGGVTWTHDYIVGDLSNLCGATGTVGVAFTITDDCGNAIVRNRNITIIDTTNPSIDIEASDETVECDGAGNIAELTAWLGSQGGAVASDACSSVTWTNDHNTVCLLYTSPSPRD